MTFFFKMNTNKVTFNNILALFTDLMALNSGRVFEAPKSASIHPKSNPYDSSR